MRLHVDDYVRGIAFTLKGESLKASAYVNHGPSLGVIRERIVSDFIRNETPDKYKVETGFIRHHGISSISRQCDLLVHESSEFAPYYRWQDYVVVDHRAARAVVEVKSQLDCNGYNALLDVHKSIHDIRQAVAPGVPRIPVLGYGLEGVSFDTLIEYLASTVRENRLNEMTRQRHRNWPNCIAIQSRRCFALRPLTYHPQIGVACCVMDFAQRHNNEPEPSFDGIETGIFLQFFGVLIRGQASELSAEHVYRWFNRLDIPPEGKKWITTDGVIHSGQIPIEDSLSQQ